MLTWQKPAEPAGHTAPSSRIQHQRIPKPQRKQQPGCPADGPQDSHSEQSIPCIAKMHQEHPRAPQCPRHGHHELLIPTRGSEMPLVFPHPQKGWQGHRAIVSPPKMCQPRCHQPRYHQPRYLSTSAALRGHSPPARATRRAGQPFQIKHFAPSAPPASPSSVPGSLCSPQQR